MSIRKLPWEILTYVVRKLDLDDLFNLSLTCKQFQGLAHDENVCRRALESRAASAPESLSARKTKKYARELRRLVKRRSAVSSATPFAAAILGVAESFIFSNGVLCYTNSGRVRILDLHKSNAHEVVIDIHALLRSDKNLRVLGESRNYDLHLIHYAHGFVSCRFAQRRSPGWLVVLNPSENRVFSQPLESSHRLFVRNDRRFLYYGTHSHSSDHGDRRWALQGCDLRSGLWFEHKIHLIDMVGQEIGSNVCFEIINGYFYGLANQALFEIEETAWTSYYTCFRFPVNQHRQRTEAATTEKIWRKFHAEGPIDDRWTFLQLVTNETSGALTIVESRKEWRSGRSKSLRTYYTTELNFSRRGATDCLAGSSASGPSGPSSPNSPNSPSSPRNPNTAGTSRSPSTHHPSTNPWAGPMKNDNDDSVSPTRSPHQVHPGDDSTSLSMSTLNDSFARSYHLSSQTFMDLINDPWPTDPTNAQRVRLRVGSRRLRTSHELQQLESDGPNETDEPGASESPLFPEKQIRRLYKNSETMLWPPGNPDWEQHPDIQSLYEVLSPSSHQGIVSVAWDDRTIVYATGAKGDKAIVVISFDPSLHLRGIKKWKKWRGGGHQSHGEDEGAISTFDGAKGVIRGIDGSARSLPPTCQQRQPGQRQGQREGEGQGHQVQQSASNQTPHTTADIPAASAKGKGREKQKATWGPCAEAWPSNASSSPSAAPVSGSSIYAATGGVLGANGSEAPRWSWLESPMYAAIQRGYDFSC